jgi:hypothetical protein
MLRIWSKKISNRFYHKLKKINLSKLINNMKNYLMKNKLKKKYQKKKFIIS